MLILVLIYSLLSYPGFQISNSYDYCFVRDSKIYVYSIPNKKEVLIPIDGNNPNLSPNGQEITFVSSKGICVYNLLTKKNRILDLPGLNTQMPVWSPNGKCIAYEVVYKGANWGISIIDTSENKVTDIIRPINSKYLGFFSPSWSSDSRKILSNNMDSIFMFNSDGTIIARFRIIGNPCSSSAKYLLNKDEKKIVFEFTTEDSNSRNFSGPVIGIYIYDIASRISKRISPTNYYCTQPVISGNRVYFTGEKPKSLSSDIYSMDFDGKNLKLEFTNARCFSAKIK